jgi:hypothetical protein
MFLCEDSLTQKILSLQIILSYTFAKFRQSNTPPAPWIKMNYIAETRSACLRVYLCTRGYGTPVSIPVHTPYINAYVFWDKLVLS